MVEEQSKAGETGDSQPFPYGCCFPSTEGTCRAEVVVPGDHRVLVPLSLAPLRVIDSLERGEMGRVGLGLIGLD